MCQTLRDYLACEWRERMQDQEGPREFTKLNMPGCSPKVQQQPNFSDCGIYLLQYVESFFKTPIHDYTLPITSLKTWFPEDEVRNKRAKIASLIRQLATSQNPEKNFSYPEIMFDGEDSNGEVLPVDEEENLEETKEEAKETSESPAIVETGDSDSHPDTALSRAPARPFPRLAGYRC